MRSSQESRGNFSRSSHSQLQLHGEAQPQPRELTTETRRTRRFTEHSPCLRGKNFLAKMAKIFTLVVRSTFAATKLGVLVLVVKSVLTNKTARHKDSGQKSK